MLSSLNLDFGQIAFYSTLLWIYYCCINLDIVWMFDQIGKSPFRDLPELKTFYSSSVLVMVEQKYATYGLVLRAIDFCLQASMLVDLDLRSLPCSEILVYFSVYTMHAYFLEIGSFFFGIFCSEILLV